MLSKILLGIISLLSVVPVRCFTPLITKNVFPPTSLRAISIREAPSVEDSELNSTSSRRNFITSVASSLSATTLILSQSQPCFAENTLDTTTKVLVLGGSGFVGSEVCKQLKDLGIDYVATSRDGRGETKTLDFTNSSLNVANEVESLAKGCTAVISCIGSIGTSDDEVVNAGTGLAAIGAKAAGVKNFVYISVAPEVRDAANGVSFLEKYMTGKQFSENTIKTNFADGYTLIEPTFIYGGDKFAISPPRVADGYGQIVEGLLSSGPFRAAASISPGIIGVALEPPVKVSAVAGAAVSGALGLTEHTLDTYDKINAASSLK